MHIYLLLFLTFLEIGAFTFGGGHAMISLIREKVLLYEWMTNEELLDFIAFAESSPGPIAINMATFVGSSQAGLIGAIIATVAVVLPSFLIILLIAAVIKNLLKNNYVKSFIEGIHPATIGLILSTVVILSITKIFGIDKIGDSFIFDYKPIIILIFLTIIGFLWKKITKKQISTIYLIIISGLLGLVLYL